MPIACSTSVLTGADGLVTFSPANSSVCLLAADFDGSNDQITIGGANFQKGDPVVFTEENGAKCDSALKTDGTEYWITDVADGKVKLCTTAACDAEVDLQGDRGCCPNLLQGAHLHLWRTDI